MNRLRPELRTLMKWAREAPAVPPAAIPTGFPARVAAHWGGYSSPNMFAIWQKAIWGCAGAAAAVIFLGLLALKADKFPSKTPYDFSPAYQVVDMDFVP